MSRLGERIDRPSASWGGRTPLAIAAEQGEMELLAFLLETGSRTAARTDQGWTPLHLAAGQGELGAARALLAAGADPWARDARGATPLHLAARHGRLELAALLVPPDSQPLPRREHGWTPLHEASAFGRVEIVQLLAAREPELDARTASARTALHLAADGWHGAAVRALLVAGADPWLRDLLGRTHLEAAEAQVWPADPLPGSEGPCEPETAGALSGIDPLLAEPPLASWWSRPGGNPGPNQPPRAGPILVVWPDGAVLLAQDPGRPSDPPRVGRLDPLRLEFVALVLRESGIEASHRQRYSITHYPSPKMLRVRSPHYDAASSGSFQRLEKLEAARAYDLAARALSEIAPAKSVPLEQLGSDGAFRGYSRARYGWEPWSR